MWKTVKVFLLLLCLKSYLGQPQYGNDLGQQISQQVQESLKGLEHLGSDIQANVQEQLRAAGIQNLGSRISAQVQQQVAPLENLGSDIEAEVQRNLLPVYAMAIRKNMADGVGGTTIVTYTNGNSPRTFIVKDGKRSICQGTITESECDGALEPFKITNREDYCYTDSRAIINNNICLANGPISVLANNNQFICNSINDDTPTLILTRTEYKNLCGNKGQGHVLYKYFAGSNDPNAIPIPNSNPYVKCRNETPGICEFEADAFMANGYGNTRTFIVKDGKRSVCQGTITEPECDGTLEPFTITNKEDYCYTSDSHTILYKNNICHICLAFGAVSVIANNNQFVCTSLNDDTPTLMVTPTEYKNLCGNMTQGHVIYKYFANSNDPQAIPIPNSNPYVKCHNETPAVCEFEPDIFIPNGRGNCLYIRP